MARDAGSPSSERREPLGIRANQYIEQRSALFKTLAAVIGAIVTLATALL